LNRNSIVLELRGTPTGYLEPSPFYWGTTEMDIVFELSQDHTPDLSSCPEAHGCTVIKRCVGGAVGGGGRREMSIVFELSLFVVPRGSRVHSHQETGWWCEGWVVGEMSIVF
jgi:hypothetical protein